MKERRNLYFYLVRKNNNTPFYLGFVFEDGKDVPLFLCIESHPCNLMVHEKNLCIIESPPLYEMVYNTTVVGQYVDIPELALCMKELREKVEDWYVKH